MVAGQGLASISYNRGMSTARRPVDQAPAQLSLSFVAEPPPPGHEGPLLTRALLEHPSRPRILKMVRFALQYFPELAGTQIKIGLARGAQGYASLEEPVIWLNPRGLSYQTIAHELVHLLQGRGLVPMGERSCDLYSLARDRILVDYAPVYLEIPPAFATERGELRDGAASLLYRTAREAIRRRADGERQYIRWFEKQLARTAPASA